MIGRIPTRIAALLAATIAAAASAAKGVPVPDAPLVDVPPLISWAKGPAKSDWASCLVLLAGRPHGEPAPQVSTLCRNDGKPTVTVLASVHPRSSTLSVEAGPEGGLRVLVGRPGGIDEIRRDTSAAPARTVALVEDESLDPRWLGDRPDLDGDGRIDLVQATYDGIALFRREEDGRMTRTPGAALPPTAEFGGEWVTVRGEFIVAPVPPAPLRWTWPETIAGRRLRTHRVSLPPAAGNVCAAWIDTDTQVYVSRAVFLSGESPRLVALVEPADKFAFFGNFELLVAPLACDETARGRRPTQQTQTDFDSNFGWTQLDVKDVTGDGRADIVIVGRQGLFHASFQIAVHPGLPDGGFSAKPAAGARSDLDPLASDSENDVDGDGRPDLVVLDRTRVMLARGIAVRGPADLPFDLRKAIFVPLPESVSPEYLLALVDFDGDGRLEAIVAGEERKDDGKKKAGARTGGAAARAEKDSRIVIVGFPPESR